MICIGRARPPSCHWQHNCRGWSEIVELADSARDRRSGMWPKTLPPFVRLSVRIRGLRMEQVTDCNPVLKADAVFHPILNKEQTEREAGRCAATQPTGEALRERQSLPGIGCCCLRLINHSRPLHFLGINSIFVPTVKKRRQPVGQLIIKGHVTFFAFVFGSHQEAG